MRQALKRGGATDQRGMSSTRHSSMATMATICCARTSSGLRGNAQRFDVAGAHSLDGDGSRQQVPPVLGEDDATRDTVDMVSGATDTLDSTGHGGRRLDLDHQVDRSHVDAELETARGHHAGSSPA